MVDNQYEKKRKIFSYILVASIWFNTYTITSGSLGYGELLFIVLIPYLFAGFRNKVEFPVGIYVLYMIYALLITITVRMTTIQSQYMGSTLGLIRTIFYGFLVFYFGRRYFDLSYAYRAFKLFCILLCGLIIVQFLAYQLNHTYISGFIPGLSIGTTSIDSIKNNSLANAANLGYLRPSGFLSEPANCAHVITLAIALTLLDNKKELKQYLLCIYFAVALLMTGSANAYMGIAISALVWLVSMNKDRSFYLKILIILAFFLGVFTYAYNTIPAVSFTINRFLTLNQATTNSSGLRLLRGPAFYLKLPLIYKFTGIGFGNYLQVRDALGISTPYEIDIEYVAMNWGYLISTGIIGIALIVIIIGSALKNKPKVNRIVLFILLVFGMSSSIADSMIWAIYLCIALFNTYECNWINENVPFMREKNESINNNLA